MKNKTDIVTTLAEASAVAALVGAGGIALPLAAAAYGVWRFVPAGLIDKAMNKKGDDK